MTVPLVFEVHGSEDAYPRDGTELVSRARAVIAHFVSAPGGLGPVTLAVVVVANPDGLGYGTTNGGPGRCQVSRRIDINRDFPAGFRSGEGITCTRTTKRPASRPVLMLGVRRGT